PFRELQPGYFFEANWDTQGARCILHTRYASLPEWCQRSFGTRIAITPPGDEHDPTKYVRRGQLGHEYYCRGGVLNPGCLPHGECQANIDALNLLRAGILGDDSLIQP